MDNIKEIKSALDEKNEDSTILSFGGYRIEKELGEGEQGVVVKARGNLNNIFAIKFQRIDTPQREKAIAAFQREVQILIGLNHRSIVGVYSGGTALYDREWIVHEGFNMPRRENECHYYIMDYIDQSLIDIFPNLTGDLSNIPKPSTQIATKELRNKAKLFEQLVIQLSEAMQYYHQEDITHKDIKPENIRYNPNDSSFIIVDFGFSRHLSSHLDKSAIKNVRCLDLIAIQAEEYCLADIGSFAIVLRHVLASIAPVYPNWRYNELSKCIQTALDGDLEKRYSSIREFCDNLQRYFIMFPSWNLTLSSRECLTPSQFGRFTSKVRIPVSGSVLLTEEVRAVIDTAEFQHLRGTRQLGPTIFVFPGANHTRFEHSLGTYALSLQYLERLLRESHGRHLDENLESSIKLIVLSALLHDIGHYPYSHWIEEIDEFPHGIKLKTHEERARDIINSGELCSVIKDKWEMEPDDIANVIAGVYLDDDSSLLANSFLNSPIDVDKVDYLIRDSIHCGVDYGSGIDTERLIDSLRINVEDNCLCLSEKGLPSLLSLVTSRNVLYQTLYWHKTVRACEAMFKRYFYESIKRGLLSADELDELFRLSDDAFTKAIYEKCAGNEQLRQLMKTFVFRGRTIYKPVYIFNQNLYTEEPREMKRYFGKLLKITSYKKLIEKSDNLAEELRNHIEDLHDLELLIETTPTKSQHTYYELKELKVWQSRKHIYHDVPSTMLDINEHLNRSRQVYLLCHPRHYNKLKQFVKDNKLRSILGRLN